MKRWNKFLSTLHAEYRLWVIIGILESIFHYDCSNKFRVESSLVIKKKTSKIKHSTYIRFSDCHTVCAFLLQLLAPTEISNSCLTLISQRSLITDLALGSFHPHRALGAWQALGTIRPIWTSVTHRALRSLRASCSIMCLWALITLGSLRPLGAL